MKYNPLPPGITAQNRVERTLPIWIKCGGGNLPVFGDACATLPVDLPAINRPSGASFAGIQGDDRDAITEQRSVNG